MTGCKTALTQGRYTWRHDQVLKEIGYWIDEKRKVINSSPWRRRAGIGFVKAGEKTAAVSPRVEESILKIARDWKIQVDLPEAHVKIPSHIASTSQRPDIVLTSEAVKQMILVELTVPIEDRIQLSSELKAAKYEQGVMEASAMKGWKSSIYTVEVGCRGYPAPSLGRMFSDFGYFGRQKKEILKKVSRLAEECSLHIWKSSHFKQWGQKM